MTQGVDQARTFLQSQLVPMLESWEVKREAEKQEWTQKWKRSADESIEQYKLRLEDASNSWLLTSATTLGQKSQTVLDTLAKAAEKRLRETCAEILSGMGDTLKERLLGISATFSSDEDDLPQKPK
jgi:vacuolar-type H+-ATPase subunit E/Vma4